MAQDIQVFGKRNENDKLSDINLTRSICLNDLTQEQLARLYKKGVMTFSDFFSGCKLFYNCQYRGKTILLNVERIMFDSENQTVVFECGYSMVHDKYFRVLLNKDADGKYLLSPRISEVPWLTSDELKTVNGQSLVGAGDIEIAAGVESLNGQTGNISLKTVNGNELIGTGDIEIKGGGDATPTGTTLYFTTTDGQTLNANIQAKNKAGTVIEPSLKTPTAWYYDEIVETMGFTSKTTNCNLYSLNGVNIPLKLIDMNIKYIMENCRYADLRKFFANLVGYASSMFAILKSLEWVDVSNFNTSKVISMAYMFERCSLLTSLDVSKWDTSNVTRMEKMFYGCDSLASLDLSNWNTSKVTSMDTMFSNCKSLASLNVSNFDTSRVTAMYNVFNGCRSLTSLDVSNWNTSQVTDMSTMFNYCESLTSLDVSKWDTSNVTSMDTMFSSCKSLTSLDLSNWNTSKLRDISWMFNYCRALTSLDLSNWDTSNVTNIEKMFNYCTSLKIITMKNCTTETIDKIKSALQEAGIQNQVQIITS